MLSYLQDSVNFKEAIQLILRTIVGCVDGLNATLKGLCKRNTRLEAF